MPYLEPMRLGSTIGGGSDTLGYTLMGMAAAGSPADALTDAHSLPVDLPISGRLVANQQLPASRREYGPFTTTAVVLRSIKLYPIPGRREEFRDRIARAKRWLLSAQASSHVERSMQLIALADAGASANARTS